MTINHSAPELLQDLYAHGVAGIPCHALWRFMQRTSRTIDLAYLLQLDVGQLNRIKGIGRVGAQQIYDATRRIAAVNEEYEPVEDADLFTSEPAPPPPAPGPALRKFKIVTRQTLHYDVLFPGDMAALVANIKNFGHFMNPQLWVPLSEIGHIIDISYGAAEEADSNVVSMFQGPQDG